MSLADPNYGNPNEIDVLFGLPILIPITLPGLLKSHDGMAMAQQTMLGYIVYLMIVKTTSSAVVNTTRSKVEHVISNEHLSQLMQKFWIIEDVPITQMLSIDERKCEELFCNTHYRDSDGRYVVHMPLTDKIKLLGRSKHFAMRQLLAMERKMDRNPQFSHDYKQYMKSFEENGYMSKINETRESGYYTPHHGVYGASKNKIRIVYNSSNRSSTGISLNECQLTGAKLQEDLAIILIRFRTHKIAVSADIKQMYCQVAIHHEHKKYQKLLWKENKTEPIQGYQIDRVAFGQTAAPYLAIRAMHQCAEDNTSQYPIGAAEIKKSFYVDDLLTGADTFESALTKINEISTVLNSGKFELAKWSSNSININKAVNGDYATIDLQNPEVKSVLGLQWTPDTDELTFKKRLNPPDKIVTKRKSLSDIGKLYDPNGYLSPTVILAKAIMQKLWKLELDWDQQVPDDISEEWLKFRDVISDIHNVTIDRWLGMSTQVKTQLHGFCDASMIAYACCIYARTLQPNGSIITRLIQSKTKVAPVKTLTIPKLELCGAYLLAKLLKVIKRALEVQI